MCEREPVLVESGLSQEIEDEGYIFEIKIYRLEDQTTWTLEVVDEDATSHVWDDPFSSEIAALIEAQKAIRTVGGRAFVDGEEPPTLH